MNQKTFLTILTLFICCASMAAARAPEQITRLREIQAETVLVADDAAEVLIVYPGPPSDEKEKAYWDYADPGGNTEAYAVLAREIAEAIEAAGGVRPPLRRADEYTPADREYHLICLGRMNNNRLAFDLYVDNRIAADDWFPGPDGYVVRTVTDPWGNGRNAIMLGGSEFEGVRRAVDHFLALPELTGRSATVAIPRQWKIHFQGMENIEAFAETIMPHYREAFFERSYYHGMGHHLVRAAHRYFITGRREYLEAFEKMADRIMPSDWSNIDLQRRPGGHAVPGGMEKYPASLILAGYAAIEDAPFFSDEFRLRMVNWKYKTFWQWCGHAWFENWQPGAIRQLAAWYGSRVAMMRGQYFRRYYPQLDLSRYEDALENVLNGLRTFARDHNVMREMGGYTHQGPTVPTLMFLRFGMPEFFESGNAAKFLEFLIQMTDNRGGRGDFSGLGRPLTQSGWLYALLYYQNPEYTWLVGRDPEQLARTLQPRLDADGLHYRLWTYIPRMPVQTPESMRGILTTGISPAAYQASLRDDDWLSFFRPGYDGRVPRERTYRILAMRSGYDFQADQYLRMYGSSVYGGGAQNRIPVLQHGRDGARETVAVRRNGRAVGFSMFSDLSLHFEGSRAGLVRSVAYGDGLDWSREILWRKGGYWLILDRFGINRADDYHLTSDWSSDSLSVRRAAGEPDFSGALDAGDEYVSASLIGRTDAEIRRIDDHLYVIDESGVSWLAGMRGFDKRALALHGGVEVDGAMFLISEKELVFADLRRFGAGDALIESDHPLHLELDLRTGQLEMETSEPAEVRFSGLRVPAHDGSVPASVSLAAGRHSFQVEPDTDLRDRLSALVAGVIERRTAPVRFASAALEYPGELSERWRYQTEAAVQTLASADLDGDGRDDVLAGLSDGRVLRLSPDGDLRWEFQATGDMSGFDRRPVWARGLHGINALAAADLGDGMRILATSTDRHVYCLDAETGELVWKFSGDSLEAAAVTDSPATRGDVDREAAALAKPGGPMWAVRVVDLNGNGEPQVLVGGGAWEGRDWYFGRLWALNARGKLQWHRFFEWATVVSQLQVFTSEEDGQRYVAAAGHAYPYAREVYVFDADGQPAATIRHGRYFRLSSGRIGAAGEERLAVINQTHGRRVSVYAAPHELLWTYDLSAPPLGMTVADLQHDGIDRIVVAEHGGLLFCLEESGNREAALVWRINLRETLNFPGTHIGRQSPFKQIITSVSFTGRDRQIVFGNGSALFVVGGDGTPLVRRPTEEDHALTALAAARSSGDGREHLIVGCAVGPRWQSRAGFVAVYDLAH